MHEIQMLGLLEHDVLSSIEVPFLHEEADSDPYATPQEAEAFSKAEADRFDLERFTLKPKGLSASAFSGSTHRLSTAFSMGSSQTTFTMNSSTPNLLLSSSPLTLRSSIEKRHSGSHRNSLLATSAKIEAIQENQSAALVQVDFSEKEKTGGHERSNSHDPLIQPVLSSSPSRESLRSNKSASSSKAPTEGSSSARSTLTSKLNPAWLFRSFTRSGLSEPVTSTILASGTATTVEVSPPKVTEKATQVKPMAIKNAAGTGRNVGRNFDDEVISRSPLVRPRSPLVNISPSQQEPSSLGPMNRRSTISTVGPFSSSSPGTAMHMSLVGSPFSYKANPSQPNSTLSYSQASLAARWQHIFPTVLYKNDIKWKSIVTPGCLPLTVEYFPSKAELESSYDVFSYDFVVDPAEMKSFMVQPAPVVKTESAEDRRRACAIRVMRGMAAVRLAQGFQFVLRGKQHRREGENREEEDDRHPTRRSRASFHSEEDMVPKPAGVFEILKSTDDPVYLSMSNEIHRISYTGEAIQVRRYVRRMPAIDKFEYQCLIWPKLGVGYTEQKTTFTSHGLENYGWNRYVMPRLKISAHSQFKGLICSLLAMSISSANHSDTGEHDSS